MPPRPQPARTEAPHRRIVVATPVEPDVEEDLERVSWPLTVLRLAVQPSSHPWKRGWRLTQRAPLVAVAIGALLLMLLAASGCASAPALSIKQRAAVPSPPPGMRCESILVSQELQLPPDGELGEVRVTLRDIPEVTGKLRVLVRKPRFASSLDVDTGGPIGFDRVMDVTAGGRELFSGETSTAKMRRTPRELVSWVVRDNPVPAGSVLLTGTGLVPEDDYTLLPGHRVEITIDGIGTLVNTVGGEG